MSFEEIMAVLKHVLSSKIVIGTVIVVILYMDFCTFVANYHKKPPRPKRRRTTHAPAPVKKAPPKDDGASDAEGAPSA